MCESDNNAAAFSKLIEYGNHIHIGTDAKRNLNCTCEWCWHPAYIGRSFSLTYINSIDLSLLEAHIDSIDQLIRRKNIDAAAIVISKALSIIRRAMQLRNIDRKKISVSAEIDSLDNYFHVQEEN